MGRKLATIQRISELNPIPNADKIEVASVLGWKVVVKKEQFKVGDLCVFVEIDSLLPQKPQFDFLQKSKFRVRTIRLRGQVSQGLALPLTGEFFNEDYNIGILGSEITAGADVTEALGIEKYLPQIPANVAGLVKGTFPSFIPKTDETRVQVLQDVLNKYINTPCYVTEKVDGCSVTYYLKDEFGVCSRNLELKETEDNLLWKQARLNKIEEKLKLAKEKYGYNFAIQCELIGQGVQKNNLKIEGNKIPCFNVFNIDKYEYLPYTKFIEFCTVFDIETVPIVEKVYNLENSIDRLVEKSKGFSELNNKVYREGIVIRPHNELVDLQMSSLFNNGRVSFKSINPDYLLKYEE